MIPMTRKRADKLSDQLRQIIKDCDLSQYALTKQTGIDKSALSRFVRGERGLSIKALDKLGECLGLSFTVGERPRKRKGR